MRPSPCELGLNRLSYDQDPTDPLVYDGRLCLVHRLAALLGEVSVTLEQARVGLRGEALDLGRHHLPLDGLLPVEVAAGDGQVALDEGAPQVRVAGLHDAAVPLPLAARAVPRHGSEPA